jgi:hypothetical protein
LELAQYLAHLLSHVIHCGLPRFFGNDASFFAIRDDIPKAGYFIEQLVLFEFDGKIDRCALSAQCRVSGQGREQLIV